MAQEKKIKVDVSKIRNAIETGIPLTVTTYTLPHEMEDYITDILKVFLTELDQNQMVEGLSYCLKELVNNAKKANTKRVYFEDKKLNLTDPSDYEEGMKNFKQDTLTNIKYYLEQQRKKGLYIKVSLQTRNNKIKVEVRNKAELTVFEYKRIHDKITRAQQYNSVEEGIAQLLDDSEGAGLGLVIMILVLRKIGLTDENYQVVSENGETITRMILPFSGKMQQDISDISAEFVKLIKGLPEFPENITEINRVINDPNSQMSDIATKISNDVSLTAELLKMVNSAAFALSSPCRSIGEAVKLAGLRGIRNLLFSIGSMKTLMVNSDDDKKELWNHAYRVAFYSYNLARNFLRSDKSCVEDAYVCGLLHDIGRYKGMHTGLNHVIDGYDVLMEEGLPEIARICLTHSFNPRDKVDDIKLDDPAKEKRLKEYIYSTEYDDYDKLVQLADYMSGAHGITTIERRFCSVLWRHGLKDPQKDLMALYELKEYFSKKAGMDIYELFSEEIMKSSLNGTPGKYQEEDSGQKKQNDQRKENK